MKREEKKQHLEDIIIGSLLNDRDKMRECALLDASTMSADNAALWQMVKGSENPHPINDVPDLLWLLTPSAIEQAFRVWLFADFDTEKAKYNIRATNEAAMGYPARRTSVTFADYVSQYIRLAYGTAK